MHAVVSGTVCTFVYSFDRSTCDPFRILYADERCFDAKVMRQALEHVKQMHSKKRKDVRPPVAASFVNQYGTGITLGSMQAARASATAAAVGTPAQSPTAAQRGADESDPMASPSDESKASSPSPDDMVTDTLSSAKGFDLRAEQLRALIDRFERSAAVLASEQQELGDVPDEFLGTVHVGCLHASQGSHNALLYQSLIYVSVWLRGYVVDPILQTLMVNPVILPTSSITMDEAVIHRHLLSDSTDPFNRKPLTREMLIPNVELKRRIEEFKASKRAHAPTGNIGPSAMDTDL